MLLFFLRAIRHRAPLSRPTNFFYRNPFCLNVVPSSRTQSSSIKKYLWSNISRNSRRRTATIRVPVQALDPPVVVAVPTSQWSGNNHQSRTRSVPSFIILGRLPIPAITLLMLYVLGTRRMTGNGYLTTMHVQKNWQSTRLSMNQTNRGQHTWSCTHYRHNS